MNYRTKLILACIGVATIIIVASYSNNVREETRVAGLMFGNSILDIHESLKAAQEDLALRTRAWESGNMDNESILEYYDGHLERMDSILARYDSLSAPPGFDSAVILFRLSADAQRQSDSEFAMWIKNGEKSHELRSHELLQDAFEYESEGLSAFNAAKLGRTG